MAIIKGAGSVLRPTSVDSQDQDLHHNIRSSGYLLQIILPFKSWKRSRRFGRISQIGSDPPAPHNGQKIVNEFPCNRLQTGRGSKPSGNPFGQFDGKFGWEINDANQLDQHIKCSTCIFRYLLRIILPFKSWKRSRRFGRISQIGSDPPAFHNDQKIVNEFPSNWLQTGQGSKPSGKSVWTIWREIRMRDQWCKSTRSTH